jgi:hypothetical protein
MSDFLCPATRGAQSSVGLPGVEQMPQTHMANRESAGVTELADALECAVRTTGI